MQGKKIVGFLIGLFLLVSQMTVAGMYTYAEKSLLGSGKWVKIRIASSGIYKLTYQDLTNMGFSNPAKVRVYGFGGALMTEAFKYPKRDSKTNGDLPEVPVYKGSDFVLFWGQGVVSWRLSSDQFVQTNNCYSSYGYYFLTDSQGEPTAMPSEAQTTTDPDVSVTTFDDYAIHEVDIKNIGATGREFYGEDFSTSNSQTFAFAIPGVVSTASMKWSLDFISKATKAASLKLSVNDQSVISATVPAISSDIYELAKTVNTTGFYTNTTNTELFNAKVMYERTNDVNCRLNYLRVNMVRNLKLYNSFTPFRSIATVGKTARYTISNTNANVQVWDITGGLCKKIESTFENNQTRFACTNSSLREWVAVDVNGSFSKPEVVGVVANQDLHALPQTDMVIIAPSEFLTRAETIANIHRNPKGDNMRVTIVQPEQIYNEFSSGTPDATAYRWFLKMFYDRATTTAEKPKYLLLFGDGTFDNRLLSSQWKGTEPANKILTFQSYGSLSETASYVCDDYFGFLDDYEGESIAADQLDLGIGRFPVRNDAEAESVVNKIVAYTSNTQWGSWKNNLCFVADDGDDNLHMKQADALTQSIEKNYKQFVVNKIYIDAFKKEITSTGGTYPAARKKLFDLLNSGVLILNYTGHGSTNSWAVEQIMTSKDIKELYLNRLPLWITATCDFSRFDDFTTTAGEEVILNPNGGGIGLITTTRVVYSAQNARLNSALNELIYTKNADGTRLRLGDILRKTKIALGGSDENKLNFTLLGDPALKLAYPEYKMEITKVNDKPADSESQTFSALSEVSINGRVLNPDGTPATSYKGVINPTVFDCEETDSTLNNENSATGRFKYNNRSRILFTGKDSVRNGDFSFKFTIPKDMSYSFKSGRINLYAHNTSGDEAQGYYENFLLGGTNPNAILEENGPLIKSIYLNSTGFSNGDIVNEKPVLMANLEDESGINVSGSGIGHDMMLVIDNSATLTYKLNEYYQSDYGSALKGKVSFNIPELNEGNHTLFFRAWDIQNNSSSATINCVVRKGYAPRIFNLYPDKNPVRLSDGRVLFTLKHDRPNTNISVKISVYNLSGVEIWSNTTSGLSDMLSTYPVEWNLTSNSGLPVPSGLYIYKASVYTDQTQETTQAKKLIIMKQ